MRSCQFFVLVLLLSLAPVAARAELGEIETPPEAPSVSEYDHVPAGLLAPPTSETKADTAVKAAELPQALGQIPGVFEIPGVETAHPVDETALSFDQLMGYYRDGKYDIVLKNLEPMATNKQHEAEELLGVMYLYGQGTPKDVKKAFALLTAAAEANRALAQHYLGVMYFLGQGVDEPDNIRALMWLHIAILHYPDGAEKDRAKKDRDNVYVKMSRIEKNRALQLARDWLDSQGEGHLLDLQE